MRVLFRTPLTPWTGYGNDGISLVRAMTRAGWEVHVRPVSVEPPLPPEVAMILTRPVQPPYDLTLTHIDPQNIPPVTQGEMRSSRVVAAWTMWEYLGFDQSEQWVQNFPETLKNYDLFLGYDDVTMETFKPNLSEQTRAVKLQGGYNSDEWMLPLPYEDQRDWHGTMKFAMVGLLSLRKNPFVAINAFKALKDEHGDDFDAQLHLKTMIQTLHPSMEQWCPGLKIHYEAWPQQKLMYFYNQIHVLVAPSWGEGKNLPALEALTTGATAILSEFGGHKEWAGPEIAYFVDGPLEEHIPGVKSMRVDIEQMKATMWHIYTNRDEARQKGNLAKRTIPAMLDWEKVVQRLGDIVKSTYPGREIELS